MNVFLETPAPEMRIDGGGQIHFFFVARSQPSVLGSLDTRVSLSIRPSVPSVWQTILKRTKIE